MKINSANLLLITFFLFGVIGCKNSTEKKSDDEASTDYQGALEYEFNMMKNPTTGKIPEGSFENEKIQARAIVENQLQSRIAGGTPYTFQGPENLGGRTRSLQYDVRYNGTTNQVLIAGGVSGGIYKSVDNGASWVRKSPTGEHYSCTSIAQDTRVGNMNTWYYTVGEATGNSASGGISAALYGGNGVYKSTDNGETWSRLVNSNSTPLEQFNTNADFISKIVVNPINGDIYIAALAAIIRSTDGGATWLLVLSGTLANTTQLTDIAVTSTGIFYAGFSGTNAVGSDGVWRSTTGALSSWTRIAGPTNTPLGWNAQNDYGRVVLAIAPSNENIVYALYATATDVDGAINGEFYRYDATSFTWTTLTLPDEPGGPLRGNDPFTTQGGYDQVISVKPDDVNAIFIGGTNAYRSVDGGVTWTRIGGYNSPADYELYPNSHPDIHGFAFQPNNSSIMLCYNDGGIQRTTDDLAATVSWIQINNGYRTYQYYYVDIDPQVGNGKVLGGAQDNGTTRNIGGTGTAFQFVSGGDGVSVGLNVPILGVQTEFVGSQLGRIRRRSSTEVENFGTTITPSGESGGLFVTLFKLDPDNTTNLYYVNDNILYRTASATTVTTTSWTSMSGVATSVGGANDISALATTRGTYSTVKSSLFMGTSNGKLFRLDDPINTAATTAPVDISLPAFTTGYISSVAVNPRNDDTLLVTISNYGVVNAFWTGNANSATPTWTAVEGNLTLPSYRSSAIIVTSTGVEYFVGTSAGLFNATGLPTAPTWAQESSAAIGNAVVTSLALRASDNTLLVGTHGYGMWKTQLTVASVLPVTLNEFTGVKQDKTVLLRWSTGSELNSKHFELEKSYDGNTFRKISTVQAAGNSSITKSYQYIDKELLLENNYYRLKSVDLDGKFTVSNTVLIKNNVLQQTIVINGNPFTTNISLTLSKKPVTNGNLKLLDQSGRLVATQLTYKGAQQILFNLPATLASASYYLRAEIDGIVYSYTLLKKGRN